MGILATDRGHRIMAEENALDQVIDIARHGGTEAPAVPIPRPPLGKAFVLDYGVIEALPMPRVFAVAAHDYGTSTWGRTAIIRLERFGAEPQYFFLKAVTLGETGRTMIQGEFESLKAIHHCDPVFAPQPFAWGRYRKDDPTTYFLLSDYREVGPQPPHPSKLTARLAALHRWSVSPTGKFGFHITTCHAKLTQVTNRWEESWEILYRDQLAHQIEMDEEKHGVWPEFQHVCRLTLEKVVPRLLRPLQSDGRTIKPCLVHGDLWDENTATDMITGEPFVFDPGSMYAHNEYELGNWRSQRHRLSGESYVEEYKQHFPPSEPGQPL